MRIASLQRLSLTPEVPIKPKRTVYYRHKLLVRSSSRRPSEGRPGRHIGSRFSSPTRLDRTFKVFLNSRVGAVLAASGYMSASDGTKYIKT